MYVNAYAYNRVGERLVIDMGLPYHEAIRRCEIEVAFIESMGDKLMRYDNVWLDDCYVPRIGLFDVRHDPFVDSEELPQWLPNDDEL
jgi:hypothetical protein